MTRRLRHDEGGWVLVSAIVLLTVMLGLGIALLQVVDVQSKESARQRQADAAFYLAEATMDTRAFLLARSWATSGSTAACGTQAVSGTLATPADPATAAGQITDRLRATFRENSARTSTLDYSDASSWSVVVCDNAGGAGTWTASLLTTARGFDQNRDGRVWVRSQAQTGTGSAMRRRALTSLVSVSQDVALPRHFAALVGGFEEELQTVGGQVMSSDAVGTATRGMLSAGQLFQGDPLDVDQTGAPAGGKLGVRCGLLQACITGALTLGANDSALGTLLGDNDVVQYASDQAADGDTISALRRQAQADGTLVTELADGAPCLPSGSDGRVVFVEKIGGDGEGTCTITASAAPRALVVNAGRVKLVGGEDGSASRVTLTSVLYALNAQRDGRTGTPVVTITGHGQVRGAVYIDHDGKLGVIPPQFSSAELVDGLFGAACSPLSPVTPSLPQGTINQLITSVLGNVLGLVTSTVVQPVAVATLCGPAKSALKAMTPTALLDLLVNGGTVGVTASVSVLVNRLLAAPTTVTGSAGFNLAIPSTSVASLAAALQSILPTAGYGPVIQQDLGVADALTTYSSAGTVQGTFREIAPS